MSVYEPVLRHFPVLVDGDGERLPLAASDLPVRPLAGGLINATYALGDHHILQRLHTIFSASVNRDIEVLAAEFDGKPVGKGDGEEEGEVHGDPKMPKHMRPRGEGLFDA